MLKTLVLTLLLVAALPGSASAAEISTHVLDLARGTGGSGVPVVLFRRGADDTWRQVGSATSDGDGRVRAFGDARALGVGTYRLMFDMSRYPGGPAQPFFPEIVLTFRVTDPAAHYHVPVVVSPYGYSSTRLPRGKPMLTALT